MNRAPGLGTSIVSWGSARIRRRSRADTKNRMPTVPSLYSAILRAYQRSRIHQSHPKAPSGAIYRLVPNSRSWHKRDQRVRGARVRLLGESRRALSPRVVSFSPRQLTE
jgi:hypothetical protein